jgi:glutathionyl-hydroquinone reductase
VGELIDSKWHQTGFRSLMGDSGFQRKPSVFRDWVTADGSAPTGRAASRPSRAATISTCRWLAPGPTGP